MYCPNCGTKLSENVLFCKECGTRISGSTKISQASTFQVGKLPIPKGKFIFISFIIGLILAFIGTQILSRSDRISDTFSPTGFIMLILGLLLVVSSYVLMIFRSQQKRLDNVIDFSTIYNKSLSHFIWIIILVILSVWPVFWLVSFPILFFIIKSSVNKSYKQNNKE
ncbi:MAG: zinc-ribbon domain-containing protein [bacterium]|nr:zinc-ribbon domain-containing protein [bacterium]